MSLFGIFGGDKKTSTTTQTTNNTEYNDNRQAVSEGVLVADGSSFYSDTSDRSQTTIVTTDGGAIEAAFGMAREQGERGEAMRRESLAASNRAIENAFGLVNEATDRGIGAVVETSRASLGFGREAIGAVERATDRSLGAVVDSTREAVGVVERSNREALGFSKDTLREGLGFGKDALRIVADTQGNALEAIDGAARRSYDFSATAFRSATNAFEDALKTVSAGANADRTFAESVVGRVTEAAKDSDTQNTQMVVKALAAVAIVGLIAAAVRFQK